jgi:hypothetical protein
LLRVGYFPDDLPPPFHTERIADFFCWYLWWILF